MIIDEFDIKYIERKDIKGQEIITHSVEVPLIDHQLMHIKFLDDSILLLMHQAWTMFFDGSFTQ